MFTLNIRMAENYRAYIHREDILIVNDHMYDMSETMLSAC